MYKETILYLYSLEYSKWGRVKFVDSGILHKFYGGSSICTYLFFFSKACYAYSTQKLVYIRTC